MNTAPAIAVARNLNQAIKENDTARVAEAEDHIANELLLWRIGLCSATRHQAYDLRRFCEKTEEALEATVFTALTRFYRGLPHTELSQSKFDFVVTQYIRALTSRVAGSFALKVNLLVDSIRQTFASWERGSGGTTASEEDIRAALDGFREFIVAANEIHEFEELIASGLFNQVRFFKSKLGEKLYWPR